MPLVWILAATLALTACGNSGSSDNNSPQGLEGKPGKPADITDGNVSTFALDVDTASYTYAARQINDGRRPDPSQVRPEEFVNYFDYRYPEPKGDGFTVNVDGSLLPDADRDSRLLRVGLRTRAEDSEVRKDAALTFVIDVSGSMAERGRLDLVQDALHYLVDQLRPADSVAIVAFNSKATVLREMTRAADKERLHDAIDDLNAQGSTNLGAGLTRGYELSRDSFRPDATNRVIILSDGLANTGTTDAETLLRRIKDEADKEISLLGVGVGSRYGDELMEQLTNQGDGFVVYISEQRQARDLFVRRLPANLSVRAYDAKAQVVFDESTVESHRLVGYENRLLKAEEFRDDRVDGGEVGPGHSVTALYVVRLRPEATGRVAQVKVRWLDPQTREASESYESVMVGDLSEDLESADRGLRLSYSAAFFAEHLRGQEAPPLRELESLAPDEELADLIRQASRL